MLQRVEASAPVREDHLAYRVFFLVTLLNVGGVAFGGWRITNWMSDCFLRAAAESADAEFTVGNRCDLS